MDDRALQPSPNPFVFIVGCLRSGTTLLRRMVDAHPELAIIHEAQWLPRLFKWRVGVTATGDVTGELIDALLARRHWADLGIGRDDLEDLLGDESPVPYSRFVSGIFDLYGARQGKYLVGEKSPGYVRYLPTLHLLWPQARMVHLVRDGRDVCLSVLDWRKADRNLGRFSTWSEDRVITAALWWEWHVRQGRETGAQLGPLLYRELRYEDLVRDPAATCMELCEFLGLRYHEGMLSYEQHRAAGSRGRAAKGDWLPPTPGMRDWRARMEGRDLERFEAAAGETLEEFGYSRAVVAPPQRERNRAARLRETFQREADVRERTVEVGRG